MGEPPAPRPAPARVLTEPPLLGRKKELAEVLQLLRDGAELVTIVGPAGVGKRRFARAVIDELPGAAGKVQAVDEPLGQPREIVYALRPLAEAPAVELYRVVTGDEDTPYAEVAELTRRLGRLPGAIVALAQS